MLQGYIMIKLDEFQKKAIDFTKRGFSTLVSAPTGSGKTVIAEHVIEDCIKNNSHVIYTAPIKALSNQKYRDFSKKYKDMTGILTGDVSINPDSPVLIMTTEIFRNKLLGGIHEVMITACGFQRTQIRFSVILISAF